MEKVITCPVCFDVNKCFEDIQETFSSYLCFKCGFMSDSRFTKANEIKMESDGTILINKLKKFDKEKGIWWRRSVVNMGKLGIIYPEGTDQNDWYWKYAKTKQLTEEEQNVLAGAVYFKGKKTYLS